MLMLECLIYAICAYDHDKVVQVIDVWPLKQLGHI
jgi:hypothetical protein